MLVNWAENEFETIRFLASWEYAFEDLPDAEQLSAHIGCDESYAKTLLDRMRRFGYIKRRRYELTAKVRKYIDRALAKRLSVAHSRQIFKQCPRCKCSRGELEFPKGSNVCDECQPTPKRVRGVM